MSKKLGIYVLCVLLVSQGVTGCAGMTEQQKDTAAGAGIGAVVGGVLGGVIGHKNPVVGAAIGATAGALVGGLIGWKVGEYKMEKVREAGQSAAAKDYKPQQGVVAKIETTAAAPKELKPGDEVILQTQYTVLAPPDKGEVKVKEVRTILFNNQQLGRLEKDSTLPAGTYSTQHKLTLPSDAAEGTYTVATLVEPVAVDKATKAQATTAFVVGTGTAPAPVAAPVSTPKVGTPPASPLQATMPEAVYVKAASVNVRETAGTNAKALATAQKGNKLLVLDQTQNGNEKWYKVRLEDGREGWVASWLVAPEP